MEAHRAFADERDRSDVALFEVIAAKGLERGFLDFLATKGHLHEVDPRRIEKPADVIAESKHSRAAIFGSVAADAFEDTEPVVQGVGENVNFGIRPIDEFAVEPDLFASDVRSLAHRASAAPKLSGAAGVR